MQIGNKQEFFPYGVSYYRPPTPLSHHWEKDLGLIRQSGFNLIRVSAFWSRIERTEDCYDFSEFDAICGAAAAKGLKVLMTLYVVNMPEWMFARYPDSRMVSAGGRVQSSEHHPDAVAGGWPGLCMDDDAIMERVERFIKAITLHYKDNETLHAFDVIHEPWEEPTQEYYIDSWKHAVYCYCPHSIRRFKAWLKEQYGSLEALNRAWSRFYSSWDQVEPPRNFGAYADWLDWRNFSVEMVIRECRAAGEAVKRWDPDRLIVNHTGGVLNAFSAAADAYGLAGTVDIPGMSNYSVKSPWDAGLSCDMMRNASGDGVFWVGETSGGSGPMFSFIGEDIGRFFAFGMPWSREMQNKHIWKMLAHGAKGLVYWMWRPELYGCETAAMGFTDREGNSTPRVENAANIAGFIAKHQEFFLNASVEQAQVAVLYDRSSSILEGYAATAKMKPGSAGLFADFKDLRSLSGLASLCMRCSLPMDLIDNGQVQSGALSRYKLLILPYTICVNRKTAAAIRRFVQEGGTVAADALCGYFQENGWGSEVVPSHGLDEVFGCKVLEYGYAYESTLTLEGGKRPVDYRTGFVQEKLRLYPAAQIVGRQKDGSPGAVLSRFGKGRAVYFGSSVFLHAEKNPGAGGTDLLQTVLAWGGVEPLVQVRADRPEALVEARLLCWGGQKLLVAINHGEAGRAEIRVRGVEPTASLSAVNLESGKPEEQVDHSLQDGCLQLTLTLDKFGVVLYWIEE